MTASLLDRLHEEYGWPTDDVIFSPRGETAAIFARLAKQKIGHALDRLLGENTVDVGVLVRDPDGSSRLLKKALFRVLLA